MTSPFCTREPSLTLSMASRPGILAETAALVRATTYPFATTATAPLPPLAAPSPPPAAVVTVTTCTGTAPPPRPRTTTTATIRIAAPTSQSTRRSARFTAGGGSSRLIRSFERSAAGGEAVTPRQAQAGGFGENLRPSAATGAL